MRKHKSIKVKVLKCNYKEFEGKVVETYYRYANGVNFVTKYGLVFLSKGDYEEVEK